MNKIIYSNRFIYCIVILIRFLFFYLILFVAADSKAEVISYSCGDAKELNWKNWEGPWQPVKSKINRKLFFEIDEERLRVRIKYLQQWYSWTNLIKTNDFFEWAYTPNYKYRFNIKNSEIKELQGSLYLLYHECEKLQKK